MPIDQGNETSFETFSQVWERWDRYNTEDVVSKYSHGMTSYIQANKGPHIRPWSHEIISLGDMAILVWVTTGYVWCFHNDTLGSDTFLRTYPHR